MITRKDNGFIILALKRGSNNDLLLVRCFIADSGRPLQTARPPNQSVDEVYMNSCELSLNVRRKLEGGTLAPICSFFRRK